MNHLDQENSIIERLGVTNTQFYESNAQSHARNFILDLELADGVIQIYERKTMKIFNQDETLNQAFYNDLYNRIISNPQTNKTAVEESVKVDSDSYAVFYQYFEPWDWVVMIYMDEEVIYQSITKSMAQMLLVVASLIILTALFLYIVTGQLTTPIDAIMVAVKSIGTGDYGQKITVNTQDEFKDLADAFNNMSDKINENFKDLNDMTHELRVVNSELELRVAERTEELQETNEELEYSIHQLKAAQDDLVESKKLAALGSLVTGISHELNTPIGIGITTASFIVMQIDALIDQYQKGKLKRQEFESELTNVKNSANLILDNLNKASNMVSDFKLIAVDQEREEKREFELIHHMKNLSQNMSVLLRKGNHNINLEYDEAIEMYSYPGAITQVVSHLIMNTLEHGFTDITEGQINIRMKRDGKNATIIYEDNGAGMNSKLVQRIFEPFFTTKLGTGSSGLGLNVVYNLVTGVLHGKVTAESNINNGLKLTFTLPRIIKDA